ncbi:hypothetical protein FSP39_003838 [Pinctada imbricata]|uniref:Iodothyronine deiodinase n=1 Tax=Pinctada imbricata TaxID=66713 RepID=A0AA88YHL1_PINIB|nr:hypothetical protein FSP39_003838 [Pinctada imbricata]
MSGQSDWKARSFPVRCICAVILILKILLRLCFVSFAGIILRIPVLKDFFHHKIRHYSYKGMETATMVVNFSTFVRTLKNLVNEAWNRVAILGKEAPDVELLNLQTKEFQNLRSLQRTGRPLVVIFGSCT